MFFKVIFRERMSRATKLHPDTRASHNELENEGGKKKSVKKKKKNSLVSWAMINSKAGDIKERINVGPHLKVALCFISCGPETTHQNNNLLIEEVYMGI